MENIIKVFIDDLMVDGDSLDICLNNLTLLLKQYINTNLVINWEKCHLIVNQDIVLEHVILERRIEIDKSKINFIHFLLPLTSVREVQSFLGHIGFYHKFIKDFSNITLPLCSLL